MKSILSIIFLSFLFPKLFAQAPDWHLQSTIGISYLNSDYTYNSGQKHSEARNRTPSSTSVRLQIGKAIDQRWNWQLGLAYHELDLYPGIASPEASNMVFEKPGTQVQLLSPFLAQHQFSLIETPLTFTSTFKSYCETCPYFGLGIYTAWQFNEREIYQGTPSIVNGPNRFEAPGNQFNFFGLGFDLLLGLRTSTLGKRWRLVFQHRLRLWEYRDENEKYHSNGILLFPKQLLPTSLLGIEAGATWSFGYSFR